MGKGKGNKRKDTNNGGDKKRKERKDDPRGSLNVAVGLTVEEHEAKRKKIENEILPKMSKEQRERVMSYMMESGDNKEDGNEDDLNESTFIKPNQQQQKSLSRRKQYSKKKDAHLTRLETRRMENALAAATADEILNTQQSGMIEIEGEMEDTLHVKQKDLKYKYLDENNARQIFDLKLPQYGPYKMEYDRSGRRGILYGTQGHVSVMDCEALSLISEIHLNETIYDATFLHNNTMFALAQKNKVFIYDSNAGAEVHNLADHYDPYALEFLPHHWLLASIGRTGWLQYRDTSTGNSVSKHRTKLGPCRVMKQNPQNAVLHLGHSNGVVTLYSPAQQDPLVKILAHKGGSIRDLAVDLTGNYMVTGGTDSRIKIWDLRTFKLLNQYSVRYAAPTSLDISQRGILGVGHGSHTTFWPSDIFKKQIFSHDDDEVLKSQRVKKPYMYHRISPNIVESLRFRPFQDICGVGHCNGFSSLVIPGSGEPNLDSFEYNMNPYQDIKQRREGEVRALLDKLSPDMIALDPNIIGSVERDQEARLADLEELEEEANRKKGEKKKEKNRMRGKNKYGKRIKRKNQNIIDAKSLKYKDDEKKEKSSNGDTVVEAEGDSAKDSAPSALKRFFS